MVWAMGRFFTKEEFYNSALDELNKYPELAARIAVGDVHITQQIGAIAQMLAMLSSQLSIAEVEPWIKARDNVVLADASARGILPMGKPTTYKATINNTHKNQSFSIRAGRKLIDSKGRLWEVVKSSESIDPMGQGQIIITQQERKTITHTVEKNTSFYKIEIPIFENGQYLSSIDVSKPDGTVFKHSERFYNAKIGEPVYHLMSDERMILSVQFGVTGKIGYTPSIGEVFHINVSYTHGDITLPPSSRLDFEYIDELEEFLEVQSGDLVEKGTNPPTIDDLREMTNFPSVYDSNAVFLGEFTFLIKKHLSPFVFLNVWNERIEEVARGANQDNINTLFVAFIKEDSNKEQTKEQIKTIINQADNSYKVKFIEACEKHINIRINLMLASLHDDAEVKKKIIMYLLERYGKNSQWAKTSGQRINWQDTVKGLRDNIIELQDGNSDIAVTVDELLELKPEDFCYCTKDTIHITVNKLI